MLRYAQIDNVVSQMPQKGDSAIFYKRKRCTTIFSIEFFPRNEGGPGGPMQAQSACPHFFAKNSIKKKLLCIVCVCKKWHCLFFEAFDLPHCQSVRVWAFLVCKKIEIRVMWTFTASQKKRIRVHFRARVLLKKSLQN